MSRSVRFFLFACFAIAVVVIFTAADDPAGPSLTTQGPDAALAGRTFEMLRQGKKTFRFDTFGDEAFWGDTLKLHQAIEGEAHGGVGPGVSPKTALAVGLKVDVDALPRLAAERPSSTAASISTIRRSTLALLKLNAVVGVTGFFQSDGQLRSVGLQCALCHSTVDDSLAPGIGRRLDGWANRDLDVGAIVNLAPDLSAVDTLLGVDDATTRAVLKSWGPGKFDAELFLDGKAFRPDGKSAATLIPPAFGLAGVNLHTWTGWGSVPHWNAFVANLEMHGKGRFFDPRLNDAVQFPIAAANGFGNLNPDLSPDEDRITSKLAGAPALPARDSGSDARRGAASTRGGREARRRALRRARRSCNGCHVEPLCHRARLEHAHAPPRSASTTSRPTALPDRRYRTSPLGGLWTHTKGGFYHDGRFATLLDVVEHYNKFFELGLSPQDENDLVQYLQSLPDED